MTSDEAGRLQEAWRENRGTTLCRHSRVVDYLKDQDGRETGNLVCRECGGIFQNPFTILV